MKIGIVVDGVSEFASLGALYPALQQLGAHQVLNPVRADIQPCAPIGVIARQCTPKASQLLARGADRVVILIDREDRDECPGELASAIAATVAHKVSGDIRIVIKNRAFENWVIADIQGVRAVAGFRVSRATERAVQPDKADGIDALKLLKRSAEGRAYDKVRDSKSILERADLMRIACNSRSFRRFLREVGCASYADQSKSAVPRNLQ